MQPCTIYNIYLILFPLSLSLSLSLNPCLPLPPTEEDDWNILIIECSSLVAKWKQLSGYLGLAKKDIDNIKEDNPNDNSECWNEALDQWIKQNYKTEKFGIPSWRTLLKAVMRVDKRLFQDLASRHQGIMLYM